MPRTRIHKHKMCKSMSGNRNCPRALWLVINSVFQNQIKKKTFLCCSDNRSNFKFRIQVSCASDVPQN